LILVEPQCRSGDARPRRDLSNRQRFLHDPEFGDSHLIVGAARS
jgi:hypothetical protein